MSSATDQIVHATDIHLITITEYEPILWVVFDSGRIRTRREF